MKRKTISILIVGMLLATTTLVFTPIENVKAVTCEVPLDLSFMKKVTKKLADIAGENGTLYWKGRDYGSTGERNASEILKKLWDEEIAGGDISNSIRVEIDKNECCDGIDDRIEIETLNDYSLEIDGSSIDKQSCFPVPSLLKQNNDMKEYTVVKTPDWWYWLFALELDDILKFDENLQNEQIMYEVNYAPLNDSGAVAGEVVYIENYETESKNETAGKIHLIEMDHDASDDAFNAIVDKVIESDGIAYIAIVTNPSFINEKKTDIPGIAVSRYDGEQIKQSINDNSNVIVDLTQESTSSEENLEVYCMNEAQGGTKYIYHVDLKKYKGYGINPRDVGFANWIRKWTFFRPLVKFANAFLVSDINDDTHHMYPSSWLGPIHDIREKKKVIVPSATYPGFSINGTEGGNLSCGSKVKFALNSSVNYDVESYYVVGTIEGIQDGTVIVSAHYDSYWGQCAMDNGAAVGAVWGVAKYFSDNDITPEYDMKFIAFGGEEYGARGANHYVRENYVKPDEKENIITVVNLDPIAMNTTMIDSSNPPINMTPWVWPGPEDDLFDDIIDALDLNGYSYRTGYGHEVPDVEGNKRAGRIAGGDLGAFKPLKSDPDTDIVDYAIEIERMTKYVEGQNELAFFDHRSGEDFKTGDVWSKVDTNDLYETANMTLRVVRLFCVDSDLDFENDCTFTQRDLDSDGLYESVEIGFDITTNLSNSGKVESVIYQNGQAQTSVFSTDLLHILQNKTTSGSLIVTLPPNASADNCDIRVYLREGNGSQEDFDNSTIYLYPYSQPIADFIWERNSSNRKKILFTDKSMPSPNATLSSWNWSFGDGNYSNQQNCSHTYSGIGTFNVTLIVTDSANKSANVTKQITTLNSVPTASFSVNKKIVLVNETLYLNSTSSDVDGNIVNSTWLFGDNSSDFGTNITYSYSENGLYTVSLFTTDNDNETSKISKNELILVVNALVDDGFIDNSSSHKWDSIQEGIDDVNENGSIYVYNGNYLSYLVNKSVSIYGETQQFVTISTMAIGIDIQSHDVYIKNFTIDAGIIGVNIISTTNGSGNTTIENGAIHVPALYGVYIDNSTNNTIKNCSIERATVGIKINNGAKNNLVDDCKIKECNYGVGIYSSSNNYIGNPSIDYWYPTDCNFTANSIAVYLDESDYNYILGCTIDSEPSTPFALPGQGIYLEDSSNTTVSTCKIYNGIQGIYVKDSRDNKVEFCLIVDNTNGIECFGDNAKYNLIVQNNISGNTNYGVDIPSFPQGNKVYYNDFFNNGNPLTNQSSDDHPPILGPSNEWCKTGGSLLTKSGPGEGNFWNDYTGVDFNADGIGDIAYGIDGLARETDDYPLMDQYGWCTGTGWE